MVNPSSYFSRFPPGRVRSEACFRCRQVDSQKFSLSCPEEEEKKSKMTKPGFSQNRTASETQLLAPIIILLFLSNNIVTYVILKKYLIFYALTSTEKDNLQSTKKPRKENESTILFFSRDVLFFSKISINFNNTTILEEIKIQRMFEQQWVSIFLPAQIPRWWPRPKPFPGRRKCLRGKFDLFDGKCREAENSSLRVKSLLVILTLLW